MDDVMVPSQVAQMNKQGEALFAQGDLEGAMRAFTRAVEIDPSHGLAQNNLGVVLIRLGQQAAGLRCFVKALQTGRPDAQTLANVVEILTTAMLPTEAETTALLYLLFIQLAGAVRGSSADCSPIEGV
jgi:Flp pilus assembly protein TadD